MTPVDENNQIFSGLILLTGSNKPGIVHALFHALAPFSTSVIDVDHIIISDRLIFTILLSLNPAHQKAIEIDLALLATTQEVDIACLFSQSTPPRSAPEGLEVIVQSDKLYPKSIASLTASLAGCGAEVGAIRRRSFEPLTISISVSGVEPAQIQKVIDAIESLNDTGLKVVIEKA